ncbi:MAG: biotin--[acetyl-CoA-carboxylase] ligase [Candidatus Omnitrophica bacterium]|nr:biotin--[acetyl-CoA-carboxylase] ligase [Candidatus Omnitrophota bacterium]
MDEKILKILRSHQDTFISGQQLSRKLSVSSSTIARHIHKLQEEGYDIQAQPYWGYKLVGLPDKLLAQEISWRLKTEVIGKKILSYNIVDSTNTIAFSLAEEGMPEGTVVFAEGQRKGKGRLGRTWASPKSQGIYLSLILRPKIAPAGASLITLLAAVSCAETIRKICGLTSQIRWPNDILVNNKKVCGILTEMNAQDHNVKFIILGIGINVNTQISKLSRGASSLKEEAKKTKFSRIELARQLLRRLDRDYLYFKHKGSTKLTTQWKNFSALSGKRVKVYFVHKAIEGLAQDIDEQGALIVRLDNGFKQHVVTGDVVKIR